MINLPFDLLLEIAQHPQTVYLDSREKNELQLFNCLWNACALQTQSEKERIIPKLLQVVRLPLVGSANLDYIASKVEHIEKAKKIVHDARQKLKLETRMLKSLGDTLNTWLMPRYGDKANIRIKVKMSDLDADKTILSEAVFMNGLKWCLLLSKPDQKLKLLLHCLTPNEIDGSCSEKATFVASGFSGDRRITGDDCDGIFDYDESYTLDIEKGESDLSDLASGWLRLLRKYKSLVVEVKMSDFRFEKPKQ